jgi:hypothetical protein
MKHFDQFLIEGSVRAHHREPARAQALIEEAENRHRFAKSIARTEQNANYIVENAYDILRQLIEAHMSEQGYKSYSHEADITYLRKLGCAEGAVRFADELRKIRNGIKYYGKKTDLKYANKVLEFLDEHRPRLLELLRQDTPAHNRVVQ